MTARPADEFRHAPLPPGTSEDKALVLAYQAGQEGAYQAIYDRYGARVKSLCSRMLGNPDDAAEAAQESFLRVYEGLDRFNGRYQLGAWIARVTTNVCRDYLRARRRRPSESFPLEGAEFALSDTETAADPEAVVIKRSEGRRVGRVLDALPPSHRAAIVLRDFDGFSYEEIAAALDITERQVKALLHRARRGFRRSWTSIAGLFFPSPLLQRLRRAEQEREGTIYIARAGEQMGDVAGSASHAATTCSVLQQCGEFVGERFATVAITVVFGAAAVGGGAGVARAPQPEPAAPPIVGSAHESLAEGQPAIRSQRVEKGRMEEEASEEQMQPDAGTGEGSPSQVAEPAPSPSPTESAPAPDRSEDDKSESEPPEPEPFAAAIGFDHGQTIHYVSPTSHEFSVSCSGPTFRQRLEIAVADGADSYPGLLTLDFGPSASMEMTVYKNNTSVSYGGGGEVTSVSRSVSAIELGFSGRYSTADEEVEALGLPRSGGFTGTLTLDCATDSLVTQEIRFSIQ
jgi:RNA polymerase sigma-70 factor, ECF subfamily